jgi:alpha-beta hydrolase superfamily lysophospholipase
MNAERRPDTESTPTSGLAEALYFDSNDKWLFGWLHQPSGGAASPVGLVICSPFGYEATCAHRSVRSFAEMAAAIGIPTLRFDYLGTGDSEEIDPEADQLTTWASDVEAAVAELQRRSGVQQVVLLGIRLGGLLAALVSQRCPAVSALALIAPVLSGPKYLRHLMTTRMAAAALAGPGPNNDDAPLSSTDLSGPIEVSGFSLSAATLRHLAEIDLNAAPSSPSPRTLVIDGESLPTSRSWAQKLAAGKGHVSYLMLPGLVSMIFRSPLRAVVPVAMQEALREWLLVRQQDRSPLTSMPIRRDAAVNHKESPKVLTLRHADGTSPGITERPVFIPADAMMFGVVTEPMVGERRRRAVLLLNSGADNHIGANRMHVSLARRWAYLGYVVLRLDLGGLGDSATRSGGKDDDVFPPTAVDEIRAAMDYLRAQYGTEKFALAGVCSGAYHVLRAAAAKLPVTLMLMINPQNYFWNEGMRIDEVQLVEVVRYPTAYLHRIFSRAAWKKLLTGGVSIPRVTQIYMQRLYLAIESTVRDLARGLGIRLPQDLGSDLQAIAADGICMSFIFARNEPGVDLLHLQAGSAVKRLGDRCRIHILKGGDHIFSQKVHRVALEELVTSELLSRHAPATVGDLRPVSHIGDST